MEHFLIRYTPPRETFVDDITNEESAVIDRHFEYLKRLHLNDRLLLAGRTERGELGIAVILAENLEQAEQIMADDPAVVENIFTGKVYPYRIALMKE